METNPPAQKRAYNISEITCPDTCTEPPGQRGCHFRMGPDAFTCTRCHLKIWRHFMGYELTPNDLQEMLHGRKITSSAKALVLKRDGKETTIQRQLIFNEEYRIRLAPKLKFKETTDEICPRCKTGKLQLITAVDDSKWYGCQNYPQCRFTKLFIPHRFNPQPAPEVHAAAAQTIGQPKSLPEPDKAPKQPSPATPASSSPAPKPAKKPPGEPILTSPPPITESLPPRNIRHIPTFILELLKLEKPSI